MISAQLLVSQMLSILFISGLLGNSLVLIIDLCFFLKRFKKNNPVDDPAYTIVYVFAKSLSDAAILVCCPFIVHFILHESWSHGSTLCVFYWLTEQACGRTSKFLLFFITIDRYAWLKWRNRFPKFFTVRSASFVCVCLNLVSLFSVLSILPKVDSVPIFDETTNVTVGEACILNVYDIGELLLAYLISCDTFTFLILTIMTAFFVCCIVVRLTLISNQYKIQLGHSRFGCERKLSLYLAGAFALHVFCAIPHFAMSMLVSLSPLFVNPQTNEAFLMFILHLLLYVNAAGTWMFSAMMSRTIIKYVDQQENRYQNRNSQATGPAERRLRLASLIESLQTEEDSVPEALRVEATSINPRYGIIERNTSL